MTKSFSNLPNIPDEKPANNLTEKKYLVRNPEQEYKSPDDLFKQIEAEANSYSNSLMKVPDFYKILRNIINNEKITLDEKFRRAEKLANKILKQKSSCLPLFKNPKLNDNERKFLSFLGSYLYEFKLDKNEFIPLKKGFLKSTIQFIDHISISAPEEEGVKPSGSDSGNFIFSGGFASCVAVVAMLSDNTFSIYHAASLQPNHTGIKNFIEHLIKNREFLLDIFVFQKPAAIYKNPKISPYIAIDIAQQVNFPVKRVLVPNYSTVICDGNTQQIILAKDAEYNAKKNDLKYFPTRETPQLIPIEETISFATTLQQVKQHPNPECSAFKFDDVALNEIINATLNPPRFDPHSQKGPMWP